MKINYKFEKHKFNISEEDIGSLLSLIQHNSNIGINQDDGSPATAWFVINSDEPGSFIAGRNQIQSILAKYILGINDLTFGNDFRSILLYKRLYIPDRLKSLQRLGFVESDKFQNYFIKKTTPETFLSDLYLLYKAYNS